MATLGQLAELVGGTLRGNAELSINGFCSLENPSPGCIAYLERGKDSAKLSDIMLGALLTTDNLAHLFPDVIIVGNPRLAFVDIMDHFLAQQGPQRPPAGIHETAVVDSSAQIDPSASVGPNAVIMGGCKVGANSIIGAGAYLGRDVSVGDDCFLHANVSVYSRTLIGNKVEINAGAVIGSPGFGYVATKEGHKDFPQVGRVVIEDNVRIGANCCIDRGALDETVIHTGTKVDNLVQIAHGVRVGSHSIVAAQTGISGGTRIGNWCVIGGQAGFQGHISVGDQSIVAAQSGVFSDLPFQSKVSGYPAKPHAQSLKVLALTFKLPELMEKLKSQEIELEMMRGELQALSRRLRDLEGGNGPGSKAPGGGAGITPKGQA
ncbi:UDP-3-O-(3-hydroxymyristoyl)glucosamine N-acyltransferase [bacterium]|nr:UDP-3-O-(3-hydroxymyristoyl)glucosamine N-acyltransferase [bacterium]